MGSVTLHLKLFASKFGEPFIKKITLHEQSISASIDKIFVSVDIVLL